MAEKRLGIIMHGVTGRMGTNQHLARSIAAIRSPARSGRWPRPGTPPSPPPEVRSPPKVCQSAATRPTCRTPTRRASTTRFVPHGPRAAG